VKTDRRSSFYALYGDLFSYVCIIFCVILTANLAGQRKLP
jgi:hypothetical protein